MIPSGQARVAGVIGWPVAHSRSPRLHGFWLEQYGIDGAYVPLAVTPDHLEAVLRALPLMGFAGVNVTLPHKEAALGCVDHVESVARRIGAVNAVTVGEDGTLSGSNTDAFGFMENLRAGAAGFEPAHGPAVILGAGGAARAVVVALADVGTPEIRIANRTPARSERLAEAFGPACRAVSWDERAEALADAALLVNATTLGMSGQPPLDIALDDLPPDAVVNDIVYAPLRTPLLAAAARRGNPTVDGLGMLLHQARPCFRDWFGVEAEVTSGLRDFVVRDLED